MHVPQCHPMNLQKYLHNGFLAVKVIPNARRSELVEDEQGLKLYLNAVPDKNKANMELLKFFKKEFGLVVEIKSGLKSREKLLRILGQGLSN